MYRQDRLCGFEATHYTIDGLKQIGVQKRKEEFGDLCLKGRKRKKGSLSLNGHWNCLKGSTREEAFGDLFWKEEKWVILELLQRLHKRRSVRTSILKRREKGHRRLNEHLNCFKGYTYKREKVRWSSSKEENRVILILTNIGTASKATV